MTKTLPAIIAALVALALAACEEPGRYADSPWIGDYAGTVEELERECGGESETRTYEARASVIAVGEDLLITSPDVLDCDVEAFGSSDVDCVADAGRVRISTRRMRIGGGEMIFDVRAEYASPCRVREIVFTGSRE